MNVVWYSEHNIYCTNMYETKRFQRKTVQKPGIWCTHVPYGHIMSMWYPIFFPVKEVQIARTEIWAPIKGDVIIGEEDTERIGRFEMGQVISQSSRVKRWGLLRNNTFQNVKHELSMTHGKHMGYEMSKIWPSWVISSDKGRLVSAVNQRPKVRRFASPARPSVRMKNELKIEVQQFGYWVLFGFTGKHREESVTVNYDLTRGSLVQINGLQPWNWCFIIRLFSGPATMWFSTRPSLQPRTGIPSFLARRFPSFLRGDQGVPHVNTTGNWCVLI